MFRSDNLIKEADFAEPVFLTHKQCQNPCLPIMDLPTERIMISPHPKAPDKVHIHVPKSMLPAYLPIVKNMHGRRWNPDHLAWEVPLTKVSIRFIHKYLPDVVCWTFQPGDDLPERLDIPLPFARESVGTFAAARYEDAITALEQTLLLKRYSHRTIKSYKNCFRRFIRYYDDTKPSQLTRAQIDAYIAHLIKTKNITESHQNQILSAIKMFYATTIIHYKKEIDFIDFSSNVSFKK